MVITPSTRHDPSTVIYNFLDPVTLGNVAAAPHSQEVLKWENTEASISFFFTFFVSLCENFDRPQMHA